MAMPLVTGLVLSGLIVAGLWPAALVLFVVVFVAWYLLIRHAVELDLRDGIDTTASDTRVLRNVGLMSVGFAVLMCVLLLALATWTASSHG